MADSFFIKLPSALARWDHPWAITLYGGRMFRALIPILCGPAHARPLCNPGKNDPERAPADVSVRSVGTRKSGNTGGVCSFRENGLRPAREQLQ